jgi:single-strand DNA-binding protein
MVTRGDGSDRSPLGCPQSRTSVRERRDESMSITTSTTIVGNLTRDPEIRYTREGQATTSLGVAVNRRWQNRQSNEWEESTSFFDVVTWRDLAENVALSLTKGMRVVVSGRLEQRSWETEDGDRRFKVEIVADEVGASMRFATVEVHKVERHQNLDIDADPETDAAGSSVDAEDESIGAGT